MKKLNLFILSAFAFFAFIACENNVDAETAKAEITETTNEVGSAIRRESAELEVELENAKVKVDNKIKELEVKWASAKGETKTELDQQLDKLRYRQDKLANDLKHIGDKIEDGWEKFKANARETLREVDEDLDDVNESL